MPECEICGEEADKLIKCKSCGAKFCEDCGSTIEKLCEFCAEDEDVEVTDDEEGLSRTSMSWSQTGTSTTTRSEWLNPPEGLQ